MIISGGDGDGDGGGKSLIAIRESYSCVKEFSNIVMWILLGLGYGGMGVYIRDWGRKKLGT